MQKSFLLSFALAFPALGLAQETPPAGVQNPEIAFYREFGAPGATGSFRAKLSRAGAGVVFLQATDHYVTLEAARKQTHGPDDWLLLATNGADHALRLVGEAGSAVFPVEPSTATWTAADVDGGVTFTLDSTTGLVLEKTLRHDQKGRGFVLEIVLRNVSSPAVGKLPLQLLGPALVLPAESSSRRRSVRSSRSRSRARCRSPAARTASSPRSCGRRTMPPARL